MDCGFEHGVQEQQWTGRRETGDWGDGDAVCDWEYEQRVID